MSAYASLSISSFLVFPGFVPYLTISSNSFWNRVPALFAYISSLLALLEPFAANFATFFTEVVAAPDPGTMGDFSK